jgi:HK97 family phage portal protein
MSLLFKPRRTEARSLSYQDVWGSGGNVSTKLGGPDVVSGGLALIPVYAATSLICDLIATSPLDVYRLDRDGATTRLPSQPQIITNPAPGIDPITWKSQALASLLLRGNAYGYITAIGSDGWPSQIIWLNPDEVTLYEEQNDMLHTPSYWWRGMPLDRTLVVHIPAYTFPGSRRGYSPLALFKTQIETGLQAQKFANDWFANSANPSGHLKNEARTLESEQADDIKRKYKAAIANRDVFVTGNDWSYQQMAVQAEESQFLQTIKATATQIASIYRVSPEDIGGETGTSLTYKTLTQDATKLQVRALNPWATKLADAISARRPGPQVAIFNLDATSKGDRTTRIAAHAAAMACGLETLDEARADENKPPLTPEQITFWQSNFKGSASAPPPTGTESPSEGGEPV